MAVLVLDQRQQSLMPSKKTRTVVLLGRAVAHRQPLEQGGGCRAN